MKSSKWLIAALLLALCISTVLSAHSHSHDHSHDHDHGHDHSHSHSHTPSTKKQPTTESTNTKRDVTAKFENLKQRSLQEVPTGTAPFQGYWDTVVTHVSGSTWMSAILCTILIGIAPILILFFIPLTKEDGKENKISVNQPLLKTLLSFAVGGLLGDVFLHLLPHAMVPHSHDEDSHSHSHSHDEAEGEEGHAHDLSVGLLVLAGIIVFFLLEKYMRLKGGHEGHSHGHSHKKEDSPSTEEKKKKEKSKEKKAGTSQQNAGNQVKITGYLNIIADTAHNFTDGMAIAASFLISTKVGISTTIAVFFHEIPHEVGDYAILIQSGFSKKQAMLVQVWTAIGAVAGCAIALAAGGYVDSVNWILPFTAGGFIYIAMVNVLPELLEESSAFQTMKELFGICLGISMMSLIALYE